MKATYTLSNPVLPAGSTTRVDLLVTFKADGGGAAARRALNLGLVIDRSGSMAGAPLKHALKAARQLVERMKPEDFLSITTYDDTVRTDVPPTQVKDKAAILKQLAGVHAGGCTNLSGGWLKGVEHVKARHSPDRVNRVLLLTDGQANAGITQPDILIATAREKAQGGIVTTTLGFGTHFNEDLLIGMASAGEGHFYYIQSPDEAEGVFGIEMEGLDALAAQDLVVTFKPAAMVKSSGVLNRFRTASREKELEISLGDVYNTEDRQVALELSVQAQGQGPVELGVLSYRCHRVVDGAIKEVSGNIPVVASIGAAAGPEDVGVVAQASRLRIARAKDEAVALADKGDLKHAAQKLRELISQLSAFLDSASFELAEEVDQLAHYAERMEKAGYDAVVRKEMRDQSYQATTRTRGDLSLRGASGGSADSLETVSTAGNGVIVKCVRDGGKLRLHPSSAGYDAQKNVQFPRSLREEGVTYVVETLVPSADGTFYRAQGKIQVLVQPGQERAPRTSRAAASPAKKAGKASASKVTGSWKDLPTTDSVGTGILVQCVKEGSKLRARVVSDGYNPDLNMRFPRDIREEGILFVVEEVNTTASGDSYIACGKIQRLVQ